MEGEKGSLIAVWDSHAKAKQREDFVDLQREMAGVQFSKMKRFTNGMGAGSEQAHEHRKKKDDDWFVLMWLMEMSDSYRRSYQRLQETIELAYEASLQTLEDLQKKRGEAERQLELMREKAIRLKDGRRVYFTKDGSALYDDNGNQLTDDEVLAEASEKLKAKTDATRNEDRVNKMESIEEVRSLERQTKKYMKDLEELKDQAKRGDLSESEVEEKRRNLLETMPQEVRRNYERRTAAKVREPKLSVDDNQQNDSAVKREFHQAGGGRSTENILPAVSVDQDDMVYVSSPGPSSGPR